MKRDASAVYVDHSGPCAICKAPTNRVEVNFECWLCVGCDDRMWAEYAKALPPRSRPTGWRWFAHAVLENGGFCLIACPHYANSADSGSAEYSTNIPARKRPLGPYEEDTR